MPELPEVETTLRGIRPHILNQQITGITIREYRLRWPICRNMAKTFNQQIIETTARRGKYLLLQTPAGTLIIHLGMSGSIRIVSPTTPVNKHDHVDICFANEKVLRFNDPRRFGTMLWTAENVLQHPLLSNLGVEPLTRAFSGNYLWQHAKKRKVPIKNFIMDNKIVVGVGNIYATEALFTAKIHPLAPADSIGMTKMHELSDAIKKLLRYAIQKGGTTLRNFVDSAGKPGYFKLHLKAYGKAGLPCPRCRTPLQLVRIGQRSSVFCGRCQK